MLLHGFFSVGPLLLGDQVTIGCWCTVGLQLGWATADQVSLGDQVSISDLGATTWIFHCWSSASRRYFGFGVGQFLGDQVTIGFSCTVGLQLG